MKSKFIFYLTICLFFVSLEYGITRPASVSIFIHNYQASFLPIVWLATLPVNFLVIYLYNNFLPKYGNIKIFFFITLLSILINGLSCFYIEKFSFFSFFQFLWKDIYILLMYKHIWSLIHYSTELKKAKFLYGFIFSLTGFGGVIGGLIPGLFAMNVGSSKLFLFTPFIYIPIFLIYLKANKHSDINKKIKNLPQKNPFFDLRKSKYLTCILFLVLFMQASVTFIDYQFNIFLEKNIEDVDMRTAYIGKLISSVHFITTFLQIVGSLFIIRFFGIKKSHFLIPFTLALNFIIFLFRPTFFMISYLFVSIKSIDFSIFSMLKEILFLPVSIDEKFRAKAVIDVFSYRSAKALVSIFLIFLQKSNIFFVSSYILILIFILWGVILYILFKQQNKKEILL